MAKKLSKAFNLVLIVADTFRSDYLGSSGNSWIQTPNLDRLASEGTAFVNVYGDGLPTIPARRVLFTGKSIIPMRERGGWQPLSQEAITLPHVLKKAGYTTAFITDTYHYFQPGMNFHKHFDSWNWIRGQEFDGWRSGPKEAFNPREHMPAHLWHNGKMTTRHFENYDERMRQYMMNTQDRLTEEDYFCARSFRSALRWLEQNRNEQPIFMLIDTFDPHEPWDAPPRFQRIYYDEYPHKRFLFGYGVDIRDIRAEDHDAIRGLYAAEVTFVDMWIGRFLAGLEDLGLKQNTVVAFTSDHGTHMGVPLIIRHPDLESRRIESLVSFCDLMPTFLDMMAVEETPVMDGRSLVPLLHSKADKLHDHVVSECTPFAAVRTPDLYYFQHTAGEDRGYGPCLYDLRSDPAESDNVIDRYPAEATRMRDLLEERFGNSLPPIE
jgi:arylsulfatase A-like enzyme